LPQGIDYAASITAKYLYMLNMYTPNAGDGFLLSPEAVELEWFRSVF